MHSLSLPVDLKRQLPEDGDCYHAVEQWLLERVECWNAAGLDLNRIVFDPGIGFGKNSLQSLQLLRRAGDFRQHGLRVLVGHSRKSFLKNLTGEDRAEKDLATLGASLQLCAQGVDILRVHDVPLHAAAFRGSSHLSTAATSAPG